MERSLVIIKPDAIQRNLIGEIIRRLETRGLRIVGAKFILVTSKFAEQHYAIHKGKPFFNGLINYITSSPVMAMVWEGENAIRAIRQTMGSTDPLEALPGTIRHDLAIKVSRNLTHASDSSESAKKEIDLWFSPNELIDWKFTTEDWVYGNN